MGENLITGTEFILTGKALEDSQAGHFLRSGHSGAEVLFHGVVRGNSSRGKVLYLDFEAYDKMVFSELERLVNEMKNRWRLHKILLHHRTGRVYPGELAVIAAVSAAHRLEAFEACIWLMDRLKESVPIWKKEYYEDGSEWVSAHP